MICDARQVPSGTGLETDICIVGSGPAGIALALELASVVRPGRPALRIMLLEAGGVEPDPNARALSEGEVVGRAFLGLTEGRLQAVGGTSRIWGAQCIRLDALDFEKRDWIADSGWPIEAATLDGHYERAERLLDLDSRIGLDDVWRRRGVTVPSFRPTHLERQFTRFTTVVDFSKSFGERLSASETITLLSNAPVTALRTSVDRACIDRAEIGAGDARLTVRATFFVLAGGAIENARLLLGSDADVPGGIGNERDLVGRYLAEHPTGRFAEIRSEDPRGLQRLFSMRYAKQGRKYWPKLALARSQQQRRRTLNCNGNLRYDFGENSTATALRNIVAALKSRSAGTNVATSVVDQAMAAPIAPADALKWFRLRDLLAEMPTVLREAARFAVLRQAPVFEPTSIWLQLHLEQLPNPQSRVRLSDRRDPLDRRRAQVDWRLDGAEIETARAALEVYGEEFARLGLGRIVPAGWLSEGGDEFEESYHQMGTTRMAAAPDRGVVDPDCRVFGTENLFVAGSSVFPTTGYCNPTLTIIALALRLADHLASLSTRTPAGSVATRQAAPTAAPASAPTSAWGDTIPAQAMRGLADAPAPGAGRPGIGRPIAGHA